MIGVTHRDVCQVPSRPLEGDSTDVPLRPAKVQRIEGAGDVKDDSKPGEDAAAEKLENGDVKENEGDEQEAAAKQQEPREHSERQKRFMQAPLWYYRDGMGNVQGPFYPGQMRDWVLGG